jgi:hypothetical protein
MRSKLIFYKRGHFELFPPIYLPYSMAFNGYLVRRLDLYLSLKNIKGISTYSLRKGKASWLNSLKYLITFIEILNEDCTSLQHMI